MNKPVLIETLANICYYAQEHSHDTDAWDRSHLHDEMGHVSYVVACFIAQNTKYGGEGVEWDIVLGELCGPVQDYAWWKMYFTGVVETFNNYTWKETNES